MYFETHNYHQCLCLSVKIIFLSANWITAINTSAFGDIMIDDRYTDVPDCESNLNDLRTRLYNSKPSMPAQCWIPNWPSLRKHIALFCLKWNTVELGESNLTGMEIVWSLEQKCFLWLLLWNCMGKWGASMVSSPAFIVRPTMLKAVRLNLSNSLLETLRSDHVYLEDGKYRTSLSRNSKC